MKMEFKQEKGRIYMENEAGEVIAEVRFPQRAGGVAEITRTFVHPSLRGQGVAKRLVEAAVEQMQRDGLKATASCSYAQKWLEEHGDGEA